MSEMSELIDLVKSMLKAHGKLDKVQAYRLANYIMADNVLSTAERLFLKGLLDQNRIAADAVPIIEDVLAGQFTPRGDFGTAELMEVILRMGRIDRKKALELKSMLMEDHILSPGERAVLENLLKSGNVTSDGEAVIRNLLYSQAE